MNDINYIADFKQLTQETIEGKELDNAKVQGIDNDVFTAQLFQQNGVVSNPPIGTKVIVIPFGNNRKNSVIIATKNFNLKITQNAGEITIFSTDTVGTTIQASIKLDNTGQIILNEGTDFAVAHTDLNTALQTFITDLNTKLTAAFTAVGGSWPGTSIDISGSKVDDVRLP